MSTTFVALDNALELQISWAKHQKVVRGLPDWKTALRMANLPNQGGSRSIITMITLVNYDHK